MSRRKVVDLVKSLGIGGISSSQVSRICKVLDTQVEAFRSRALEGQFPYVWLYAAYHKIKELSRVVCHGPVTSMTFSMGANI
jgi:transposase-like protein